MAICVIAVVAVAPCQCFSPGANQMTSPGRISSTGPSSRCTQPQPAVTINICPSGCVCHAVRPPGSNVTLALPTRPGSGVSKSGSIRTVPVNQSLGPFGRRLRTDSLDFHCYAPPQDCLDEMNRNPTRCDNDQLAPCHRLLLRFSEFGLPVGLLLTSRRITLTSQSYAESYCRFSTKNAVSFSNGMNFKPSYRSVSL